MRILLTIYILLLSFTVYAYSVQEPHEETFKIYPHEEIEGLVFLCKTEIVAPRTRACIIVPKQGWRLYQHTPGNLRGTSLNE